MAMNCYKKGIETPAWVFDEVYKCSHRVYSTGFFFPDNPPKQTYETSGYERNYDIVGVVDYCSDGVVYATQRNRFFHGDEIEILSPGIEPVLIKTDDIFDENGEKLDSVNHSCMKFNFKYEGSFPSKSIIRKKV